MTVSVGDESKLRYIDAKTGRLLSEEEFVSLVVDSIISGNQQRAREFLAKRESNTTDETRDTMKREIVVAHELE